MELSHLLKYINCKINIIPYNETGGDYKRSNRTDAFINQLNKLDLKTLIYPGHDYLENNLKFTLSIEPNNIKAKNLLFSLKEKKSGFLVTDFATEYEINTFFRLENKQIIEELIKKFGRLEKTISKKDVFLMLRELRNSW